MARTLPPKKKAAAPGAPNGSEGNTDMPAALRIAAAPVSKPDEAACPVAALATRAATLLRGYYSLMTDQKFAPKPPFPIPNLRDSASKKNDATPEGIANRFRDELYAIAAFAAFEVPNSKKGALFQLYLAANTAGYMEGDLNKSKMLDSDWTLIEEAEERSKRLLFNAMEVLDADADDDLKLLRRWFFDEEWEREIRGAHVLKELKSVAFSFEISMIWTGRPPLIGRPFVFGRLKAPTADASKALMLSREDAAAVSPRTHLPG